jgi:hypothetical protein
VKRTFALPPGASPVLAVCLIAAAPASAGQLSASAPPAVSHEQPAGNLADADHFIPMQHIQNLRDLPDNF